MRFVLAFALATPLYGGAAFVSDGASARDGCGYGRARTLSGRCVDLLRRNSPLLVGPQRDAPRYSQAHYDWCYRYTSDYRERDNTHAYSRFHRAFCRSPFGG